MESRACSIGLPRLDRARQHAWYFVGSQPQGENSTSLEEKGAASDKAGMFLSGWVVHDGFEWGGVEPHPIAQSRYVLRDVASENTTFLGI